MSIHFSMNVGSDNSAFDKNPEHELARILRVVANNLEQGHDAGACRDVNGNVVGAWYFAKKED